MHTDLVFYTIILHYCVSAQVSVYPGEEFQLAVKATDELDRPNATTVEPPNKGHFGSRAFVLFSEVVLWWEVRANMQFIAP